MSNMVKNGDLPAYEMTKREDIAKAVLAGLLANSYVTNGVYPRIEDDAVYIADALLAALEKTK